MNGGGVGSMVCLIEFLLCGIVGGLVFFFEMTAEARGVANFVARVGIASSSSGRVLYFFCGEGWCYARSEG